MPVTVAVETPLQDDVRRFVKELNDYLKPLSPREFQFQMSVEQMAEPSTTLFIARDDNGNGVGMGALKVHSADLAEVKRLFTLPKVRGQRVGRKLLDAIEALAREKNITTLKLETGSGAGFEPAWRLNVPVSPAAARFWIIPIANTRPSSRSRLRVKELKCD